MFHAVDRTRHVRTPGARVFGELGEESGTFSCDTQPKMEYECAKHAPRALCRQDVC